MQIQSTTKYNYIINSSGRWMGSLSLERHIRKWSIYWRSCRCTCVWCVLALYPLQFLTAMRTMKTIPASVSRSFSPSLMTRWRSTLNEGAKHFTIKNICIWSIFFSLLVPVGSGLCHSLSYGSGHHQAWCAPHVTSTGHVGEGGSSGRARERRVGPGLQYPGLPGQRHASEPVYK